MRIKVPGQDEEQIVFVQGGFLEVQPDVVTVLSDTAIRARDLDEAEGARGEAASAEEAMQNRTSQADIAGAEGESLPAQWRNSPRSGACGGEAEIVLLRAS